MDAATNSDAVTTLVIFGLTHTGLLIWILSAVHTKVNGVKENHGQRIEWVEEKVSSMAEDIAELKGERRQW